jgi:hypothetical protein
MFSMLLTPLGRYLALAAAAVAIMGGVYFKIRADAVAERDAQAMKDQMERMSDALRAGDAVDVRSDRLRDADRNARD